MAYRLNFEEELPTSARRAVAEQLGKASDLLEDERQSDPVEAVHGARKNLKKSRAVLRLLRPDMRRKRYRRENRALRDAGRRVSHVRDADVLVETVDDLRERFAGRLPAAAFDDLHDRLAAEARAVRDDLDDAEVEDLVDRLRDATGRVDDWALGSVDWTTAEAGIARAYKRGRKAFKRAVEDPTVENLHEWRKRVKDLWYHHRLLTPAFPVVLKAAAKAAHRLSDVLGDDHDLSVLTERLHTMEDPPAEVDDVLGLIEERRDELQAEARVLGERMYAERPKAFKRRIRGYTRTATARPELAAAA